MLTKTQLFLEESFYLNFLPLSDFSQNTKEHICQISQILYKDINYFALQILSHVRKEKKYGNEDFPEEMSFGRAD